jgi:Tfp pilus assembly protein PilN
MIRALAVDFAPRRRRPPAAGIGLLALALALAAGLAWQYRGLSKEIERIEAQLESRQPQGARRAAATPVSAEAGAEIARVSQVVRQLSTPWNALFASIESAVGENVALLGIQPDPAAARVTLTAEARNFGEALWFAQRLSAGGTLAEAFLTGHELRRDGSQRPVRFTISARWLALEGAAPADVASAKGSAP